VELQNRGELTLTMPQESIPTNLSSYAFSFHAAWF
jgi:hypothetical protein